MYSTGNTTYKRFLIIIFASFHIFTNIVHIIYVNLNTSTLNLFNIDINTSFITIYLFIIILIITTILILYFLFFENFFLEVLLIIPFTISVFLLNYFYNIDNILVIFGYLIILLYAKTLKNLRLYLYNKKSYIYHIFIYSFITFNVINLFYNYKLSIPNILPKNLYILHTVSYIIFFVLLALISIFFIKILEKQKRLSLLRHKYRVLINTKNLMVSNNNIFSQHKINLSHHLLFLKHINHEIIEILNKNKNNSLLTYHLYNFIKITEKLITTINKDFIEKDNLKNYTNAEITLITKTRHFIYKNENITVKINFSKTLFLIILTLSDYFINNKPCTKNEIEMIIFNEIKGKNILNSNLTRIRNILKQNGININIFDNSKHRISFSSEIKKIIVKEDEI